MKRVVFDYSRPLTKKDASVYLLNIGERNDYNQINVGIVKASEKYGFEFKPLTGNDFENVDREGMIRLLIIVVDTHYTDELAQKALAYLDEGIFTAVSIALEYGAEEHMFSFIDSIERMKALSKDRINFLRPVKIHEKSHVVPAEKIVDNSICDSVRVKYKGIRLNDKPLDIDQRFKKYFKNAGKCYEDYHLYHRSPSDGYFAIRSDTNPGSFYVTATKTYKNGIDVDRVSEVVDYKEDTNELTYQGQFLPSSDSVEAAVIFKNMPEVKTIMHTHASIRFTRNKDFEFKIKVPVAPYGEYETGKLIEKALIVEGDGFIIMEDHGEVFTSEDDGISKVLMNLLEIKQ